MSQCQWCRLMRGNERGQVWGAHIRNCSLRPRIKKPCCNNRITCQFVCENCNTTFQKEIKEGEKERFCKISCARSFASRNPWSPESHKRILEIRSKERQERDRNRVPVPCKYCGKPSLKGRITCSDDCVRMIRMLGIHNSNRIGGFREKGGRGKQGRFRGFLVQSTWECAFLIWCLENGKSIQRNRLGLKYEFQGSFKKFFPDFEVDGKLIEIKGWPSAQTEAKQKAHPNVTFLFESDLSEVFAFAEKFSGLAISDLFQIYDKHNAGS